MISSRGLDGLVLESFSNWYLGMKSDCLGVVMTVQILQILHILKNDAADVNQKLTSVSFWPSFDFQQPIYSWSSPLIISEAYSSWSSLVSVSFLRPLQVSSFICRSSSIFDIGFLKASFSKVDHRSDWFCPKSSCLRLKLPWRRRCCSSCDIRWVMAWWCASIE